MKRAFPIWTLLPAAAFLLLAAPDLVRKTMYNDGLWYATIARNLAEGRGSFWEPFFTETIFPAFHEHPPLVFGLQSVLFSWIGDHIAVEKTYALATFLVSTLLMVAIWRKRTGNRASGTDPALWFFPVLLWIINEVVYVYYPAHILECTLGAFTLAAVYALMHADPTRPLTRNLPAMALGAVCTGGAVLSKGFPGLFPLAYFMVYHAVERTYSLRRALLYTSLFSILLLVLFLPLAFWENARESLLTYWDTQVMASIRGERTEHHFRESRWYIVRRLLEIHVPALILVAALLAAFRPGVPGQGKAYRWRDSLFFLGIGLAASLPLMISRKQSFYYLLPSLPFFAMAMALPVLPALKRGIDRLRPGSTAYRVTAGILILAVMAGVVRTALNFGGMNFRDREVLHDAELFGAILPHHDTAGAGVYNPNLIGYLYRRYHISLDTSAQAGTGTYWISEKQDSTTWPPAHFVRLDLPTRKYELHRHRR